MYCRNCGKEVEDGKELCEACGVKEEPTEEVKETVVVEEVKAPVEEVKEESANVEVVKEVVSQNEKAEESQTSGTQSTVNNNGEPKSKIAAGLFGIFLGSFGVHNFYLGYTGKAIAQLLITVLSCGFLSPVSAIWGFIEGILVLTGDIAKDVNGVPLKE